jgi:hypothetical protein
MFEYEIQDLLGVLSVLISYLKYEITIPKLNTTYIKYKTTIQCKVIGGEIMTEILPAGQMRGTLFYVKWR